METTLKIYIAGVIFSALLNIVFVILNPKVTVKNIMGYCINIISSWACPLTIVGEFTSGLLESKGLNKVLWTNHKVSSDPRHRSQGFETRKHIH